MVLHLSNEEFYSLTPRQYHLLLDQHQHQIEHDELLTGILASTIANFSMVKLEKQTKAVDFMPSLVDKEPIVRRKRRPSGKALAVQVRAAFSGIAKVTNG